MKIRELIETLSKLDPDLNVYCIHDEGGFYDASSFGILGMETLYRVKEARWGSQVLWEKWELGANPGHKVRPSITEVTAEQGIVIE